MLCLPHEFGDLVGTTPLRQDDPGLAPEVQADPG